MHFTWLTELLPDDNYRQLWTQLLAQFDAYNAVRLMTEALYIAAKQDKEVIVATYLAAQVHSGTLTLNSLQKHFQVVDFRSLPTQVIPQHSLSQYDQLLSYVTQTPDSDTATTSQRPQIIPPAHSMATL